MLIQKIERVNSMTIRKMANEELSQCVDVIRKSYETEAVAFGITEMNCPQHAAFILNGKAGYQLIILKCSVENITPLR